MAIALLDLLKKGFGIYKPKPLRLDRGTFNDSVNSLIKFTDTELPILMHRHIVEQKSQHNKPNSVSDIIAYIQPEHERSVQLIHDAERAKALAPEISRAEQILISSIMSPNDLQEADPIYEIENMPDLPETVINEIIDYLKTRFTKQYNLGEKMTHWAKEALFRSGAAVILTLPEATLTRLVGRETPETTAGMESFDILKEYCNIDNYKKIRDKEIYSKDSFLTSSKQIKIKKLETHKQSALESFKIRYNNEFKAGVESLYLEALAEEDKYLSKESYNNVCTSLEAMTATIVTKIEEGDVIKISENPEVLRFGKAVRHYQKTKLGKDFDKLWEEQNIKTNIGKVTNVEQEKILDMTNYLYETDKQKSLPFNIELPAESVIPICIPGQKEEKLGYFVLVDSHGQPIKASSYITSGSGCTTSSRIANAYATMYGQVPTPGGIQSPLMSFQYRPGMTINPSDEAMSKVFNYILDNILRKKLNDVGLSEVSFDKYEPIATCMLYRLLENKETSLVFVPESLITYVAFDYRENGQGKSLLEDISFVLSLIVALLVTNLMAMMKNAVAKQEISVDFDEEETNQDQIIDQIRSLAIQKGQLNITTNPFDIANSVTEQSISVKAVKHPNAPGFNIDRTFTTDNMPKADTELLETLQSWLTTAFGIPHSVFNQLDDAEFSRSVATSNLFFSQLIRTYQKILSRKATHHVKLNLKYSQSIREGLYKIINNHVNIDNNTSTPISDGGKNIKGENIDVKRTLMEVIENISISLPAPNLAPNKAQYDIFQDLTTSLNGVIDNLYPDQIMATDDQDGSNGLTVLKSFIRADMTKNLLQHMGMDVGLNIQELDEFLINNRENMLALGRIARNFNQDLKLDKTAQTTETTEEDSASDNFGNSSDDSFGSSSDDFSMDNDIASGNNEDQTSTNENTETNQSNPDDFSFDGL